MTNKLLQYVEKEFCREKFYAPKLSPYVKSRILTKKIASHFLGNNYKYPRYDFFWTNALQAIALLYAEGNDKNQALVKYYQKRKNYSVEFVDSAMHGYVLIKLRERGVEIFDDFIHQIYLFLDVESKKSTRGILPYRGGPQELYFVDTLGMVCPFLMAYAKVFKKPEASELAYKQMHDFLKYGMDGSFPYHAYDDNRSKLGALAWGRGIGWMLWGMVDMLEYMDETFQSHEEIKESFISLIESVAKKFKENGYLGYNLLEQFSHIDHSVTAMFGYSVARGINIGLLDAKNYELLSLCSQSILQSTDSHGVLHDTSGECKGLGAYSESYGNYPWGQAPAAIMMKLCSEIATTE